MLEFPRFHSRVKNSRLISPSTNSEKEEEKEVPGFVDKNKARAKWQTQTFLAQILNLSQSSEPDGLASNSLRKS